MTIQILARVNRLALGVSASALVMAAPALAQTAPTTRDVDQALAQPVSFPADASTMTAQCDAGLDRIAAQRAALEGETGPAAVETTFRRYDDLILTAFSLSNDAMLIGNAHRDGAVRQAGLICAQRVGDATSAINLSRPIYDRLSAIDAASDPQAAFYLQRTLRAYRDAGVDRDDATRAQILRLQEGITSATLAFQDNINKARTEVTVRPDELEGLPADYIANHPVGDDGLIRVSTDYPDLAPVMMYARDEAVRRRLSEAYQNRAPENAEVLARMLALRHELATLLGRRDFAELATADKMIGSPEKARAFLADLDQATLAPARRDYARMAARLNTDRLMGWNVQHVQQLLRKEDYAVDPQEVRRYFAYDNVRGGVFQLTEDLFGVKIRPWDTPVWADDVEAYEVVEGDQVIGRFYLDNHPREGKYSHAAVAPVRVGLEGRALPVAVLLANFPAGDHATGLMEHRDVETFLHEFGHLLHVMFSGKGRWALHSPFLGMELDFAEAPSQMLENWVWDYETLRRFAVDADGQPIPEDLVARMNRARGFAEAFGDRTQMGYAAISLDLHTGEPPADLGRAAREANNRYALALQPETVHPENSFGHLGDYSALYYTYLWSKTISTDLFTVFEAHGLRDPETARRYRDRVLAPGSSRPAARLVEDFLGRPVSLDAYRARLAREP